MPLITACVSSSKCVSNTMQIQADIYYNYYVEIRATAWEETNTIKTQDESAATPDINVLH